jgi:exosortase D (VPLPA-CTERM-specific)
MRMQTSAPSNPSTPLKSALLPLLLVAAALVVLYRDVAVKLVHDWATDGNYSHGFLIVPIALYFVWERRARLAAAAIRPSAWGLPVAAAGILVLAAGLIGAELFLSRVSLLIVLAGIVVFMFGWRHLALLAFPLGFLLLMIPIPAIIFNQIAFPLQLLASRFGEFALNVWGVPVLREGNVIVLANTPPLEVAEACSGIRSLVSLLTLAIVYGYFMDRRTPIRVLLALLSIPIAILANGVRVAGTGLAAHWAGAEAAEGFFHEFSGWLLFVVAFVLLFSVHRVIARIFPAPAPATAAADAAQGSIVRITVWRRAVCLAACLVLGSVLIARASKTEKVPLRQSFDSFPLQIGTWIGQPTEPLDDRILEQLRVDDYVNRVYFSPDQPAGVGLYIGYYRSQRQGQTMHSPLNCLPGAGWQPTGKQALALDVSDEPGGSPRRVVVNEMLIQKGDDRQMVLYWYQSHERVVASEYWAKVWTVMDAVRLNRTDAALVRVVAPVLGSEAGERARAEQTAVQFARAMFPLLGSYLPR